MSPYRKFSTSFVIVFFFASACSSPVPKNKWQHDAAGFCHDYQEHFLQGKDLRAKLDLSHAKKSATQSAQLKTLIDIELTVCAMKISNLDTTACPKAEELLTIEPEPSQSAYLDLMRSQPTTQSQAYLPSQYQDFAKALSSQDSLKINQSLSSIEPLSSRLLASSLSREYINTKNIQELINALSYRGYKKPLLSWLAFQMNAEQDPHEKARLKAKIDVLTSN